MALALVPQTIDEIGLLICGLPAALRIRALRHSGSTVVGPDTYTRATVILDGFTVNTLPAAR